MSSNHSLLNDLTLEANDMSREELLSAYSRSCADVLALHDQVDDLQSQVAELDKAVCGNPEVLSTYLDGVLSTGEPA